MWDVLHSLVQGVAVPARTTPDMTVTLDEDSGQWLSATNAQLEDCHSIAEEEEIPSPSDTALDKSRELLQRLSKRVTDQPEIYPMDEGNVAIDFRSQDGKNGVLFVVDDDGSGAMFHCTADSKGYMRVDNASHFLRKGAVSTLRRAGIQ